MWSTQQGSQGHDMSGHGTQAGLSFNMELFTQFFTQFRKIDRIWIIKAQHDFYDEENEILR